MIQFLTIIESFVKHENECISSDRVVVSGSTRHDRNVFNGLDACIIRIYIGSPECRL